MQRTTFLGAAGVLALAFAGIYFFFVTTRAGQLLDALAFDGAQLGQRSLEPLTHRVLDAIPIAGVAIALIVAMIVAVVRSNWVVFGVAILAALAANILTQLLKNIFLLRPDLGVPGYAFNSLPSGHTTVAAAAAMVVFLVSSRRTRPIVAGLGAVFTVVAGSSTLVNQWHRPSDVVAALLVVAFCGCLAGAVLSPQRSSPSPSEAATGSSRARVWSRTLLWAAAPFVGLTLIFLVVLFFGGTATFPLLSQASFVYAGGIASIAAVVLLLTVAANRAFRTVR